MNRIKQWMGILWMLLGVSSVYYLIRTALHQVSLHPVIDTKIQWGVFVIVSIPIAAGMVIFGWYACKGEYKN